MEPQLTLRLRIQCAADFVQSSLALVCERPSFARAGIDLREKMEKRLVSPVHRLQIARIGSKRQAKYNLLRLRYAIVFICKAEQIVFLGGTNARIASKIEIEHVAASRRTTRSQHQVFAVVDLSPDHPLRQR